MFTSTRSSIAGSSAGSSAGALARARRLPGRHQYDPFNTWRPTGASQSVSSSSSESSTMKGRDCRPLGPPVRRPAAEMAPAAAAAAVTATSASSSSVPSGSALRVAAAAAWARRRSRRCVLRRSRRPRCSGVISSRDLRLRFFSVGGSCSFSLAASTASGSSSLRPSRTMPSQRLWKSPLCKSPLFSDISSYPSVMKRG